MGISIIRFQKGPTNKAQWGVLNSTKKIVPLLTDYTSLATLLNTGLDEAKALSEKESDLTIDAISLLSPITKPCKLICQGLNYAEHRLESYKSEASDYNLYFRKDESSLTGAHSDVKIPSQCEIFDYEIELGIIIGKTIEKAVKVTESNVHEYVAGWLITNDLSARDMMFRATYRQWYRGKSARGLCPAGPILFIPNRKDWKRFNDLKLTLKVNGEIRQEAKTDQMIFKPADTITEISENIDLNIGDCILTGTPGGIGVEPPNIIKKKIAELLFDEKKQVELLRKMSKKNPKILRSGDVVECTIATEDGTIDLGIMKNVIV